MKALMWFRSDLRVADNTALHHAALSASGGVVGLYVISPADWRRHDTAACRVEFVLRNLRELSTALRRLNIPLLVRSAAEVVDVAAVVVRAAVEHGVAGVHANREYEINERRRDDETARALTDKGIAWHAYHDQTVVAPGEVLTQQLRPYTVFTPFKRAWFGVLKAGAGAKPLPPPRKQTEMGIEAEVVPERVPGFESGVDAALWPAGEREAQRRLETFVADRLEGYKEKRDFPGLSGTSDLSPYLAAGVLSARQCLAAAAEANGGQVDGGLSGPVTWISELVWREFYKHVLAAFPRVCMHKAFRAEADRIRWVDDPALFAAWCEGRTGYPIVDAAQRQLLRTGWMHNRLRMISAMFLTKDLRVDWRLGERHFMRHLIDGDLAQNNGGWQWSAGTGTDAAPYFRIFNPATQSERFDPDGGFIRAMVPELRDVGGEAIHDPPPLLRARVGYPEPIVDHAIAREETLRAYKAVMH